MEYIRKLITKIFEIFLPFADKMAYLRYFNNPLLNKPLSNIETYKKLLKEAENNTYSIADIDLIESAGYAIDKKWLNSLAYKTQVVIKKSELNYAHGRVLYTALRDYIMTLGENNNSINIIETGTARGFSALCMAKALSDAKFEGSIFTIDVLPHDKKMFWNCAADHIEGKQSRYELIAEWKSLIEKYIVFIQGSTKHILPKIYLKRINFAFLDGVHTYENVLFEFNVINKSQKKGDVIVFDDYNKKDFPGVFKAINLIAEKMNYEIKVIQNQSTFRNYVIATKNV